MKKHRSNSRTRERGSAYVAVLLVLILLTIFGMSLALITSMERQIGANQKLTSRLFYAADSGPAVALAPLLVQRDPDGHRLQLYERNLGTMRIREELETSRVTVVSSTFCDLCQINQGPNNFQKVNHFFNSTSRRLAGPAVNFDTEADRANLRVVGQQQVSMMVEIQPWDAKAEDVYDEEEGLDYSATATPPPP